jgi:hypothetical protein
MFGIVVWFEYLSIDVAGGLIGARYCNFTVLPLGDATVAVTLKCLVVANCICSCHSKQFLQPLTYFRDIWYARCVI